MGGTRSALRCSAWAAGILALGLLGACGATEPSATPSATPRRASHIPGAPRRLRVLDPGGRMCILEALASYVRSPEGRLGPAPGTLDELEGGTELLVVAAGCRIERVPVAAAGDTIARLRPGIPVHVRVRWDGAMPEGIGNVGLSLVCRKPQRDEWARGLPSLQSASSAVLDDDLPSPTTYSPIRGMNPTVLLYVCEPGNYYVQWTVDVGSARSSFNDVLPFDVADGGPEQALEREFPSKWMARTAKGTPPRKGR